MKREQKTELLSVLNEEFNSSSLVVVTHYLGLTVAEMSELRGKIRETGAKFRVTKNRITRLALAGTKYEKLTDLMTGPTAISYSQDPIAAAKAVVEFSKKNDKLKICGAVMDGNVLSAEQVKALASLPSLDELRGKIVGLLQAPAQRIASITAAPAGQVARVIGAYADQGKAA